MARRNSPIGRKNTPQALFASPQSVMPRLLTREQAATYCGLSVQGFSNWVKAGRLPPAIGGTARWDLKAIDAALDLLSGVGSTDSATALDQWRARRARGAQGNS